MFSKGFCFMWIIVKRIIKAFTANKNGKENLHEFHAAFSQLSHDLKNNLIAIRASAGGIKQFVDVSQKEMKINNIEKAITDIDKKINHSMIHLNMVSEF